MYHLRLKGDHYQMGVKRGNIFQKAHISFPLQLDNFQLEHGKQSEEILRKFFPEICEEVRGVSDAIGTDGCCVWAAVCITWRTTSPLRLGAVLLLHIQAMAEQYTVEIMTYHLICVKEAKVKSMHRKMETGSISLLPLSLTAKKE